MRTSLLYILLVAALQPLKSQNPCTALNYHAFRCESIAGTYEDLGDNGTEIEVSDLDDGISAPQEIGFAFEYNCQTFTQFILNTNGFIKLGTETTPKTNLFFSNAQSVNGGVFNNADSNNVNLLVAFNHDIEEGVGAPDFRVHTTGSAPYRVCTVQWENMREWTYEPEKQYDNMDFQIKLYETTNIIEFVYGEWDPSTNISNYKTAACGLKGSGPDDSQLLVVVKSSSATWDNVTFHNGNYAPNESFNFGNPPDRPKPDAGRTYRFTPTYDNDLSVARVYSLGEASTYYSSPQTISATILNSGFNTQANIPVILDISNSNHYRDTQYLAELAFGESAQVTFNDFSPTAFGPADIRISVPDDDFALDNGSFQVQHVSERDINYATDAPSDAGYGFLSGAQGIYYNKYVLNGEAEVTAVRVYISADPNAIGQRVFANVLNGQGVEVARTEDYLLREEDLSQWLILEFSTPAVLADQDFYAGFGMRVSAVEYKALGVQSEIPVRSGTYYTSFINGTGLKEMDLQTLQHRFMIGVTLKGTPPAGGMASGDVLICNGSPSTLHLEGYSGYIQWQSSPDGISDWSAVEDGSGGHTDSYTTPNLNASAYYRAEVYQPGAGAAYSNHVLVEVTPATPVISADGDVLISSATEGNQWYDLHGPITGATGQLFLATTPGTYYVIVTDGDCVSPSSNPIELLTVGTSGTLPDQLFTIYPNPFKDALYLKCPETVQEGKWSVMNMQGIRMADGHVSGQKTIQLGHIPAGPYLFVCRYDDHYIVRKINKMDD